MVAMAAPLAPDRDSLCVGGKEGGERREEAEEEEDEKEKEREEDMARCNLPCLHRKHAASWGEGQTC